MTDLKEVIIVDFKKISVLVSIIFKIVNLLPSVTVLLVRRQLLSGEFI